MNAPVLLTATDCHLCEHARGVLAELGVDWREVDGDTDEGRQLAASVPPMRPVLLTSEGRVLAYGRVSLRRLRRKLGPPAPPALAPAGGRVARADLPSG